MELKLLFVSLCFLALLATSKAATTSPPEETTEVVRPLDFRQREYIQPCYVEKSKVADLMLLMNNTVRILNPKDEYLECRGKMEVAIVDADDFETCTDDRIVGIQKDLTEVVGSLFQLLAIRTEEPSDAEVSDLDWKKIQLIDKLNALRVFYGPSPCEASSIVIYPIGPLIEYVEWNLEQVLALLLAKTPRPSRPPPPPTTPATPKRNIIEEMLRPETALSEILKLARSNPAAMSKTLPKIISQRYKGRAETFDILLNFVEELPTTENKIVGFAAIQEEMHRYNPNPETVKLAKLANSVERLNEFAATTINFVDTHARSKLNDLVNDPGLSPFILMLNSSASFTTLTELARLNPIAMSSAVPLIVANRFNTTDSPFESVLNFVEGLPTTENRIHGLAAIHEEMHRYNRTPEALDVAKLAHNVERLREETSTKAPSVGLTALSKLTDLVNETTASNVNLLLNPNASFVELTEIARVHPPAMSVAVPSIVSQRYNGSDFSFEQFISFIESLPTSETKIFGYAAIYDEMQRYNQTTDVQKLAGIASAVLRLNKSVPKNLLDAAASGKLADLTNDPDLKLFITAFDLQTSFADLTEMARLHPAVMSAVLPDIISQRYNANVPFNTILNFIDNLSTTENQFLGFAAVYQELTCCNRTLDSTQLIQLARKAKDLQETIRSSSYLTAKFKLDPLLHDLDAVLLIGEKAACLITNVAYAKNLDADGNVYPYALYVNSYEVEMNVYPKNEDSQLTFRIVEGSQPYYAADINPNQNSIDKYHTKPSERYMLRQSQPPADSELGWKLVRVSGTSNQFRILSAKHNDFVFAHTSAIGYSNWRRVLLGRKGFSGHDHVANADRWTFNCKPGTYTVPSF